MLEGPHNLVHTLGALIDGLAYDVRHQLDDALAGAAAYERELARSRELELEIESKPGIAAQRAFCSWVDRVSASVMVGASDDTLRAEFARQTAYVYIVRLLLVRFCEDKGLFEPPLSRWLLSVLLKGPCLTNVRAIRAVRQSDKARRDAHVQGELTLGGSHVRCCARTV